MKEIITKLRDYEVGYRPHVVGVAFAEAADKLEAQEARIAVLERLLKRSMLIFDRTINSRDFAYSAGTTIRDDIAFTLHTKIAKP